MLVKRLTIVSEIENLFFNCKIKVIMCLFSLCICNNKKNINYREQKLIELGYILFHL